MEPVIEIQDLSKRFRGKQAVDRLSLTVPRGAIFALLGDNGAGKTTTIKMLTGLLRPDSGRATILGRNCWSDAAILRRKVGYVPERPRFYDWMTVSEIGWFTSGFHGPHYLERYQEMIDQFKLDPKTKLSNLSKGSYSKIALALALAMDPEVLVLDEPTSGLDLLVRREFLGSMVGLAGEGRTIVISSHQIVEVERIASHVAFMSQGKLLLAATMEELRRRVVQLRLRYDGAPPDPQRLGKVLQRNGTGNLWQAIIQDPDRDAVNALYAIESFFDVEEAALDLEDVYCALLSRSE